MSGTVGMDEERFIASEAELALLRKARELIVPVIEETKLAHISKTKHFRHMMYRTRNVYFHPYYRYP